MNFAPACHQILTKIKLSFNLSLKPNNIIHLLVCLNLAITLPLAAILNIWLDEAYALDTTAKNIQYAFNQAIDFELQPPLYFVLLNIWRNFNDSIFWARLFSVICIVLTIYVVALISERFIKTIHPAWFVAFFAFNPFVIWAALEIRVYAFAMLLSALLLLFFFDGYFSETPQTKAKVLYILVSIFALYTQYYLGCLLVAHAVVLLISRRWKSLVHYLLSMSIVAIFFGPMLLVVLKQVSTHRQIVNPNFLENFIFEKLAKINQLVSRFYLYIFIPFLLLAFIFLTDFRLIGRNHWAIWTINITSFFLFSLIIVITKGLLSFRHTVPIFIVSLLGIFLFLSSIKYKKIRKTIIIFFTTMVLLFYSQRLYNDYSLLAKQGDWKRVAEHIMTFEKPEQEILVFRSIDAVQLSYYYSGINTIIPIPKPESFKYDLHKYTLNNEEEIFKSLPRDSDDIWLVENVDENCSYFNFNYNCHILADFVSKYYSVESSKQFFETKVSFLHRKPNSSK